MTGPNQRWPLSFSSLSAELPAQRSVSWAGVETPGRGSPLRFLLVLSAAPDSMGWPEPRFVLPETVLPTAEIAVSICV